MSESIATKYAKKVANSLATKIGGAIAGEIVEELFPPGTPNYFDEVYGHIAALVNQALVDADIRHINGALHSIESHLKNEYVPAKQKSDLTRKSDREHLFELLNKYEETFLTGSDGMLETLRDEKHAHAGLGVFLYGASLHLALFQEMANVDPYNGANDGDWGRPTDSSYGEPVVGTVAKTAADYAQFARPTWQAVWTARDEAIKFSSEIINPSQLFYLGPGGGGYGQPPTPVLRNKLTDGGRVIWSRGGRYDQYNDTDRDRSDADYYRRHALEELRTSLSDPDAIIDAWKKLIQNPIKLA